MRRTFLALQGPASPFFAQLSAALLKRGHSVSRVNFCGGDVVYGGAGSKLHFRGAAEDLAGWYGSALSTLSVTDVLMFGDCRNIHSPMHTLAASQGVPVHVFEEGYVRPHWITLERDGVNGRSKLSRDPDWYRAQRAQTPPWPPGTPTGYNLYERALHDISYRAANTLYAWRFPAYDSHRPRNGVVEYAGLCYRAFQTKMHHRHADAVTSDLVTMHRAYYIFPLQLNSDAQIVVHSPFSGIRDAIKQVLYSFAQWAPSDALLVIKNHPLDTGLIGYRNYAEQLANQLDIAERLRFLDAGHLPTLLEHAQGVVVVNSTVGLSALHHGRPLVALGTAIYDMDGLTWQGGLDSFWREGRKPDMALYEVFRDYVVHHTQINGDFYTCSGIEMACAAAVRRLEETPCASD
jgi:capsular polysaccharide export protein